MRATLLAIVATVFGLVLLLSFKPHELTAAQPPPAALSQDGPAPAGQVEGDSVDTRWGPVQVAISVAGGKITAIDVLRAPDGNRRDIEINDRALPILTQEALAAQSASIDTVSGATYTSEGYIGSLQSAIDRAGL
ncbi:FMN-binding protein [Acrocarpospora macrocephala]|uniref:FMN-binding protein n=1 Tax=Acrocarpospora macrocephala TaxID=150177 RepID=A0A5M3WMA0_9ACTN|nr:FMN-binding protein [Acrocarpospora macrocephala]GES09756.1 FMN-binding protein [Acrocarpospora macrocephala]